jgi:hypothetical protein
MFKKYWFILVLFMLSGCDEVYIQSLSMKMQAAKNSQSNTKQNLKSQTKKNNINRCDTLKVLPPQGLSCLHCTLEKAESQANIISDILIDSCLKNIAITYLVDGSFGSIADREGFLLSQIEKLTSNDRTLWVYFYLGNGPWQRRWDQEPYNTIAPALSKLSPQYLRSKMHSNKALQVSYQQLIIELTPVLAFAHKRGAQVSLIPFLEDNLDDSTFNLLYELTLDALPVELPISIGRNPCENCFSGNETGITSGIFKDIHTISSKDINSSDGLVTNDGIDFYFSFESSSNAPVSLHELRLLRNAAFERNNAFILWSAKYQGIPSRNSQIHTLSNPKHRAYKTPTNKEKREIIDFFRTLAF